MRLSADLNMSFLNLKGMKIEVRVLSPVQGKWDRLTM